MRKIKVWLVTKYCENINESVEHIYTVVKSKEQRSEYILNKLYLENKDKFDYWCEVQGQDSNSIDVFIKYVNERLSTPELNKYVVMKATYNLDQLCALLRTLAGCLPVGASYESKAEYEYIQKNLKEDTNSPKEETDSPNVS